MMSDHCSLSVLVSGLQLLMHTSQWKHVKTGIYCNPKLTKRLPCCFLNEDIDYVAKGMKPFSSCRVSNLPWKLACVPGKAKAIHLKAEKFVNEEGES